MTPIGTEPIYHGSFEAGKPTPESLLRLRINEAGIFLSQLDRDIALGILSRLEKRFSEKKIDIHTYKSARDALDILVPKKSEKGTREIADIKINPLLEQTIRSRIESTEIDTDGADGAWGSMPEVVKREVANASNLIIEMTTNCTVRCSFCDLANKGPIEAKISFPSVVNILQYFKKNQKIPSFVYRADTLYWGTDPFDIKWKTPTGERDYTDLAKEYWKMMDGEQRFLYTSTAIPIGEEMRILRFADEFITKKRSGEISENNQFRISQRNANLERSGAIRRVLRGLHDGPISLQEVYFSDNRNDNVAMSGKLWNKDVKTITIWDVTGPNCRDDVVIGVRSVDGVVMQASSNERPKGEDRFPILEERGETKTYHIPLHQEKPNLSIASPSEIYPDAKAIKVTITGSDIKIDQETSAQDPHRAFLRMAGFLHNYAARHGGKIENITAGDKLEFRKRLTKEAELVQQYLDNGADNVAMKAFMEMFRANGFI